MFRSKHMNLWHFRTWDFEWLPISFRLRLLTFTNSLKKNHNKMVTLDLSCYLSRTRRSHQDPHGRDTILICLVVPLWIRIGSSTGATTFSFSSFSSETAFSYFQSWWWVKSFTAQGGCDTDLWNGSPKFFEPPRFVPQLRPTSSEKVLDECVVMGWKRPRCMYGNERTWICKALRYHPSILVHLNHWTRHLIVYRREGVGKKTVSMKPMRFVIFWKMRKYLLQMYFHSRCRCRGQCRSRKFGGKHPSLLMAKIPKISMKAIYEC